MDLGSNCSILYRVLFALLGSHNLQGSQEAR